MSRTSCICDPRIPVAAPNGTLLFPPLPSYLSRKFRVLHDREDWTGVSGLFRAREFKLSYNNAIFYVSIDLICQNDNKYRMASELYVFTGDHTIVLNRRSIRVSDDHVKEWRDTKYVQNRVVMELSNHIDVFVDIFMWFRNPTTEKNNNSFRHITTVV